MEKPENRELVSEHAELPSVKTSNMQEVLGIPKSKKHPASVRVERLPKIPPELTNAQLWRWEA